MPITTVTDSVQRAAAFLRQGALVAFPTETVYGLGADAFNDKAVSNVYVAKGRPPDNPMIVHVLDVEWLTGGTTGSEYAVASEVPAVATLLLDAFAPGPIAVVIPRAETLPSAVSAGLDSVAVRIPSHPTARALLTEFGRPIAAPSANASGRPSPTTWRDVERELEGRIDCILSGPPSTVGLESTVVDCRSSHPVILRHGFVTAEQIADVVGVEIPLIAQSIDDNESTAQPARSPGTRHRHYAPNARVLIVDGTATPPKAKSTRPTTARNPLCGFIGLDGPEGPDLYHRIRICRNVDEYASELYSFFRACEDDGIEEIHCASVPPVGLGRALMDRLTRAATATN